METGKEFSNEHVDLPWLLERLPVGGYTCDAEGLITYFNENAVAIWGRAPSLNDSNDRFCGSFRLYSTDGAPIPHEDCWMGLALRNRRQYDGEEIVIERPDGSRSTVLAHANPFYEASGILAGAVNVLIDISERKRMEEELQRADRRKDEFLAMLSHEMRNPLATVVNSLQVIGNEAPTSTTRKALEVMNRQVSQLTRLLDDLVDVSRITLGRLELRKEPVNLIASLEAAVETCRSMLDSRGHTLLWDVPDEPVFLSADASRLTQIFGNLVSNAAKYTPTDGLISIEIKPHDDTVRVAIIDNGIGVPLEMRELIFENFSRAETSSERSDEGLGIGLNVARQLAILHGGDIEVASEGPGKGSTFTVSLPLIHAPKGITKLPDPARGPSGSGIAL